MPLDELDVQALRRWVITARSFLAEHADTINALNVFPVPDRDTGTNMSITMDLAVDGLAAEAPPDLLSSVGVLARTTALSARGNSGVILSQLVRGLADVVIGLGGAPIDPPALAVVLRSAATQARAGVRTPLEGTMLSVADRAASAAESAQDSSLAVQVAAVVSAGGVAVARTQEQLPLLTQAGVVDAGAVGYWLVLRALQHVVLLEAGTSLPADQTPDWLARPERTCAAGRPREVDGPAYELMFVLEDSDQERVASLAGALEPLGDSLVVAGGPQVWSVHVHLDDPAAGVNAAVAAGRAHRFALTRFADQLREPMRPPGTGAKVLVALESPGLVDLAKRGDGVEVLLDPDADALGAALAVAADDVVLIADSAPLRDLADSIAHVDALVCRAAHPAQALAALAVRADQGDGEALLRDSDAAAGDVRVSTVGAGVQDDRRGDVEVRCVEAVDALVTGEVELVTLVAGADAPARLLERLTKHLAETHPGVEINVFTGGRAGVVLDIGCE